MSNTFLLIAILHNGFINLQIYQNEDEIGRVDFVSFVTNSFLKQNCCVSLKKCRNFWEDGEKYISFGYKEAILIKIGIQNFVKYKHLILGLIRTTLK